MFNEPGRGNAGPWECPYCGTSFNAPLMVCPQCGAKQLASAPRTSATHEFAPHGRPNGFGRRSRSHWNPAPFGFGGADLFSEYTSRDEERTAHRSWLPFYAIGGLVSVAFLLVAYMISHRDVHEPILGVQIVEGSVLGPKDTPPVPVARPTAVHSAPALVADVPVTAAGHMPPLAQVPPATHGSPPAHVPPPYHAPPAQAGAAHTGTASPGMAARTSHPNDDTAVSQANAVKASTNARADVARSLATARASLDKDNLAPARRAIMTALAEQPGNGYALQMQAELVSREQERDSLLGYARLCAREGQWVCAWHNAGHALTVDASSSEAKELLSRSIAEQRPGTVRQVDSGPPGPPIDDQ